MTCPTSGSMMAYPQDDKRVGSITAMLAVNDVPRLLRRRPHIEELPTTPAPPCRHTTLKRWIPLDLVQNTAEYLGCVPSLLSFRGVSTGWQGAVSDAVGFLNGRCWTRLKLRRQCGEDGPLWTSLCLDDAAVIARCALLCLAPRLETFAWLYMADQLDFALRLLGESNTVLTALSLRELHRDDSKRTMDLSGLQNCHALKTFYLTDSGVTDAGIRGLELIPTLENLNLWHCTRVTDVSFLRNCRALKWLDLATTSLTDAGIRGLELIPTLDELSLRDCKEITDVSFLQNCRALKKLVLTWTSVTDTGIRGLELIPALEELNVRRCRRITDVNFLQNCRALKTLSLQSTNVTDAGIRGLELIPTLVVLNLCECHQLRDLSALRNRWARLNITTLLL
jgi:hypothetical protein